MRTSTGPAAVLAGLIVLVAGCTAADDGSASPSASASSAAAVATSQPDSPSSLVADADPVAAAVSTSRLLFDSSPVVVLAPADDQVAGLIAASAAVGLGVPLLLTQAAQPAGTSPAGTSGESTEGPVGGELDRLGATAVLAVGGPAPEAGDRDVVQVSADTRAVEDATGLTLADTDPVPADGIAAAVAALDPDAPAALQLDGAEPTDSTGDGRLPDVQRGDPLTDTTVVASGDPASFAGIATARAAGAEVLLTGGVTDPRADTDLVTRLGADKPAALVALGADLAGQPDLGWQLATAATGTQLPGGGQLLFPGRLMVALYGTPGSPSLGVLGEQDLPASIARAQQTAAPYEALVDTPVVPTFEILATVASGAAGPDGDYSNEIDVESLRPWVEAAGAAGLYVVLDLQSGRADFLSQAQRYQSLLELPYVGLALDPEWRLQPDETPLQQIGSVGIAEVNQVVTWLADLTRANALPQKLLVLHQFQLRMITDRDQLDTSRSELAILVHVDGQGGQPAKQSTWQTLHQGAPAPLFWGWKNFYDEDTPMLSPQETIDQVLPRPELITYQ